MRTISIDSFAPEKEYIVEAMFNGKFKVVGKVLTDKKTLTIDDLETIWDFANWGVNNKEQMQVCDGVYRGCKAECNKDMIYIIMDAFIDAVNANILIRKHYDTDKGYYIKSARRHREQLNDIWCFGTTKQVIAEYC